MPNPDAAEVAAERLLTTTPLAPLTHQVLGAHTATFRQAIADALRAFASQTVEEIVVGATCESCGQRFSIIEDGEGEWTRCAGCEARAQEQERCVNLAEAEAQNADHASRGLSPIEAYERACWNIAAAIRGGKE